MDAEWSGTYLPMDKKPTASVTGLHNTGYTWPDFFLIVGFVGVGMLIVGGLVFLIL